MLVYTYYIVQILRFNLNYDMFSNQNLHVHQNYTYILYHGRGFNVDI